MSSLQFEGVLKDASLVEEIQKKLLASLPGGVSPSSAMLGGFEGMLDASFGGEAETANGAKTATREVLGRAITDRGFEAIVERFGRPSLIVRDNTFEIPASDVWKNRLLPFKSNIDRAILSVGRVELSNHQMSWAGTAWVIAPGVVVTNRHVASLFAQKRGESFAFRSNPLGNAFGARVDFKEEHLQLNSREIEVEKIIYVADFDDQYPDLAFMKLKNSDSFPLPPPLPLYDGNISNGQTIVVIGYPAYDDRNNAGDMARIFGDAYGVKRLAPGEVRDVFADDVFTHDATTLGGNSGSLVLDVASGQALGLHFAGEYLRANFAVKAATLRQYLSRFGLNVGGGATPVSVNSGSSSGGGQPAITTPTAAQPVETEAPITVEQLDDRDGYSSAFLGDADNLVVPLPTLPTALKKKAAKVKGAPAGAEDHVLNYTNYSVVMNKDRRLAFFTATNIDGDQSKKIKRAKDTWYYDPRIEKSEQVGNELYLNNDLDRGHLTRRLDPVWGDDYQRAEKETFFFTNCTPQHHLFNTKTWLSLEDYILSSADTRDFRACIFTGPVLDDEKDRPFDFKLKDGSTDRVKLPLQFWKVVAMVREDGESLSATAYIISQYDLISNLEFVFGQFKTYQVPIEKIEKLTGLDFNDLSNYDPLKKIEGAPFRELNNSEDIIL